MSYVTAAAIVGGALIGGYATNRASKEQSSAAKRAADTEMQMFRENAAMMKPWRDAGEGALNKLIPLASEYTPFTMRQFTQDSGYGFRMSEGMKAIERGAAARGNLLSGGTLKAMQRYGQDMASQEYMNAFNRYQAEREARLNPLQSLAGVGQTAAQSIGNYGAGAAQSVGNMLTGGAAARASGYVGGANVMNQAVGQYLNYTQGQNMINMLNQQRQSSPTGGYTSTGYPSA